MGTETSEPSDPEAIRERYNIETPSLGERIKEHWIGYAFILPSFLMFIILFYIPLLRGIQLTFMEVRLGGADAFVGLEHYLWVATNDLLVHSVKTTLLFAFSTLALQVVLGLVSALFLNELTRGYREWLTALVMAPYFAAGLAAGLIWKWFLSGDFGLITRILHEFGMEPILFLNEGALPFLSVVLATVWHDFPWAGVIYVAALKGIPREQYEAAAMDGASRLHRFRDVTLPHLVTPTVIILVLRTVFQIKEFAIPFELTGGGPVNKTLVLSIFTFRVAYLEQSLGRGYVIGMIMLVLAVVPAIIYIRVLQEEKELYT